MNPMNKKLLDKIAYLKEIDSAIFWHWSFMSRMKTCKSVANSDYIQGYQSKLDLANEARELRNEALLKARRLRKEI